MAQYDTMHIHKAYRAWVVPLGKGHVVEGLLYEVRDSSVVISNSLLKSDYYSGTFSSTEVPVNNIKKIQLRKKGAQGTGLLIGGVAGAAIGILIGLLQNTNEGNDFEKESQKGGMVVFPILLTGIGLSIGGTVGAVKIPYPVKGSQEKFDFNRSLMEERSIKNILGGNRVAGGNFSKLTGTLTDIDGNVYQTLALGGQVWMAGDLKVTRFQDGSEIPGVTETTIRTGSGYSWYAVSDGRKICPAGWHVPSYAEWVSMYNSLGGEYSAGSKMAEKFTGKKPSGQWWSSTGTDADNARALYLNDKTVGIIFTTSAKTDSFSVRCIRD